jgi:hypothetical protein
MRRLDHEAEFHRRSRTGVAVLLGSAIITATIILESCGGGGPVYTQKVANVTTAAVFPQDSTREVCLHLDFSAGGSRMAALMDTLKWPAGCIPMYTDDQRFHDGGSGQYGPLAHIAPLSSDTFSVVSKFDVTLANSILVGVVLVDTTDGAALPATYQALGLNPGFSCVFLRHEAGSSELSGWHAYVTKLLSVSTSNYCPAPTAEQQLRVIPVQDANFRNASDYPLIGRFREATYAGHKGYPLLGLKCVAAFCLISPDLGADHPHVSEHLGVHPGARNWQVFGWNDEQHPGRSAVAGGPIQSQWTWNASIIAAAGLGNLKVSDFSADTLVHVATVYLRSPPPKGSKYDTKWHWGQGENHIFLHHVGTDDNAGWSGVARQHFKPTLLDKLLALFGTPYEYPLKVTRTPHAGVTVEGTARFAWSDTDEDAWARCDAGCCRIEAL